MRWHDRVFAQQVVSSGALASLPQGRSGVTRRRLRVAAQAIANWLQRLAWMASQAVVGHVGPDLPGKPIARKRPTADENLELKQILQATWCQRYDFLAAPDSECSEANNPKQAPGSLDANSVTV